MNNAIEAYTFETIHKLKERISQLEQRLGPIDPGGGDRVDELESAIGHLRSTIQVAEARAEQAEQRERQLLAVIEQAQQHDHADGDATDCSLCAAIRSVMDTAPTTKENEV